MSGTTGQPEFREVWRGTGDPPVSVETATVTHAGHAWEQTRMRVGGRGGVVVVAERGGQVALVRLWRPSVGAKRLELPRGLRESDRPEDDAARELREETGFEPRHLHHLGELEVDTSLLPTSVHAFHAEIQQDAEPVATDGEVDRVVWVDVEDLASLLSNGELRDAISLAAVALWRDGRDR
ncbi:NUDIX hydrolase [Nocardioides marinus]|uniref:ADP-ribose pyrophosphatase n=1 Tax=Nocardioides marinus TaxID=374514 RepID=A0A7Z0C3U9_9ACTN|nr:ADP-ribose pyrophosphatase [Nocardioides marinus]